MELGDLKGEAAKVAAEVAKKKERRKKKPIVLISEEKFAEFDNALLATVSKLRMINFNQIAFVGRKLEGFDEHRSYRLLWCDEDGSGDTVFRRLTRLIAKGFIIPWKQWDPDRLLTSKGSNYTRIQRKGCFFILGRDGRRYLETKGVKMFPLISEELRLNFFPIARWLTASSVALTLEHEGYALKTIREVWEDREDVKRASFKPDFIAEKDGKLYSFMVFESHWGVQSINFVANVGRYLNCLRSNAVAVILIRSKEAFKEVYAAMMGDCLAENQSRVFIGDLHNFKMNYGHTKVANVFDKEIEL